MGKVERLCGKFFFPITGSFSSFFLLIFYHLGSHMNCAPALDGLGTFSFPNLSNNLMRGHSLAEEAVSYFDKSRQDILYPLLSRLKVGNWLPGVPRYLVSQLPEAISSLFCLF